MWSKIVVKGFMARLFDQSFLLQSIHVFPNIPHTISFMHRPWSERPETIDKNCCFPPPYYMQFMRYLCKLGKGCVTSEQLVSARPMLKLLNNKSAANVSDTFRKYFALLRSYGMRFTGILSYHGIKVRYILSIAKLESHT